MKWGQPDVPEPADFVRDTAEGKVLGFDGSVVNANLAKKITSKAAEVKFDKDLVDEIWAERPEQEFSETDEFIMAYAGETSESKIARVRKKIEEKTGGEDYCYLLNSLDDIAWLFNLRGSDIPYNPVFYSFLHISDTVTIYLQEKSLSDEIREYLTELNVEIRDYNSFEHREEYSDIISEIKTHKTPDELNA